MGLNIWNMGLCIWNMGICYLKYEALYLKYGTLYLKYGASYLRYAALYLKYGASRWNMGLFIWNMGFYIWNMGLSIWKYGASIWQTCGSHLKYGVLHLHKVWAPVHTIKHLAYTSQKGEGSILFCNCYLDWIFSYIWIVFVQCFFAGYLDSQLQFEIVFVQCFFAGIITSGGSWLRLTGSAWSTRYVVSIFVFVLYLFTRCTSIFVFVFVFVFVLYKILMEKNSCSGTNGIHNLSPTIHHPPFINALPRLH